ncbi:hypothetical protein [Spirosoma foliorum]|uniref:Uncharacterized protein n=1 Tax=Spirosoma foliorum TaxID=2710596 RepID=A0A7G5GNA5_9BACT|nr:hypothetical protein [Spirosoma foliorum]QMW00347.1 hypothetical protein H3H32_20250 [Spirosoma foliorum]
MTIPIPSLDRYITVPALGLCAAPRFFILTLPDETTVSANPIDGMAAMEWASSPQK